MGKEGRHLRRLRRDYPAITVEDFLTAVLWEGERQTLDLIVASRSNEEMAQIPGISAKTIDREHQHDAKLYVCSAAQFIVVALREGLIDATAELYQPDLQNVLWLPTDVANNV